MYKRLCLAFVFVVPLAGYSQDSDTNDDLKAKAESVLERTKVAVEKLEERIKHQKEIVRMCKRGDVNANIRGTNIGGGTMTFQTKELKREAVADAEKNLAEMTDKMKQMKSGNLFDYGDLELPLKLGQFGQLQRGGGRVIQVLGEDSFLMETDYTNQSTLTTKETLVMVNGVSTKGLVDNSAVDLDQVFEVAETTTYDTALGGTNTVFVLVPFDIATLEPFLKK